MTTGELITEQELNALNAIDAETSKEDRICITRDHETGEIAWRFGTRGMSPFELIQWTLFNAMMNDSGYRARIEALEAKIAQLESKTNES